MRLNRYLASCGIGSRRKCDQLIADGKVLINGEIATLGTIVNAKDKVLCEGQSVLLELKAYFIFNKPKNILTTMHDPRERPTVKDYLTNIPERVYPVGRLDFDSEGLLILTNDGILAHRIQHPKHALEKEYLVRIDSKLNPTELEKFKNGLQLEEGLTKPCTIELSSEENTYKIILKQGWFRQIRRMFEVLGKQVAMLKRTRVGNIELRNLRPGHYKTIDLRDIQFLKKQLGLGNR
jgi:pseudouridine synthase